MSILPSGFSFDSDDNNYLTSPITGPECKFSGNDQKVKFDEEFSANNFKHRLKRTSSQKSNQSSNNNDNNNNGKLKKWHHRIWRNVLGIEEIGPQPELCEAEYVHHRPYTLEHLHKVTRFSKKELQLMYRGFKEACPSGFVTLNEFKDIYSCFFPNGDASKYATAIFRTLDRDKNSQVTFDEFVMGLSVLSRGSIDEKLRWIFGLYDEDNDGYLTRHDVETVLNSIYEMVGPNTEPPFTEQTLKHHADDVFNRLDENKDGMITLVEFLANCKKDENLVESLDLFDTYFCRSY